MTTQTALSSDEHREMEAIKHDQVNANFEEVKYVHIQDEALKPGLKLVTVTTERDAQTVVVDEHGRTFFEVSIHPFAEQVADENGQPVDGD